MLYAFCEGFQNNFDGNSGIKHRQRACYRLKRRRFRAVSLGKNLQNPGYWQKNACLPQYRGEKVV